MSRLEELTNEAGAMGKDISAMDEQGGRTPLGELIQRYCPDGVEYHKVKEFYTRLKGTPITAGKMKEIATPSGLVRIFAGGKTVIDANEADIPNANITRVPAVLVQSRGVIDVVYYDKPFTFKNEMWAYTNDNKTSVKYLYYILKNNVQTFRDAASGMGSLPQISLGITEDFEIPVPPLPVQEEIVRILDSFTELQAELQAELQKRKQQYNYYRDNLLSFNNIDMRGGQEAIRWMRLGDICEIKGRIGFRGYTREDQVKEGQGALSLSPSNIQDGQMDYSKGTYITWAKYNESPEIMTYNGDIIFCKTASIGKVALVKNLPYKATINPQLVVLKNIQCNAQYLTYVLETTMIQNKVKSLAGVGSVPNISQKALAEMLIPIPTLSTQENIVGILSRFDTLANDLSVGLPLEIEKRQQQYEYYRDRLLNFRRIDA